MPPAKREVILEKYFKELSCMTYDKAKEWIDSDKDFRSSQHWSVMGQLLIGLVVAERAYYSLNYVNIASKWPIRKDHKENLKVLYSSCQFEVTSKILVASTDVLAETVAVGINRLCNLRVEMIDAYSEFNMNCQTLKNQQGNEDLIKTLSRLKTSGLNEFDVQCMLPIKILLHEELSIFESILSAEDNIMSYNYFDALLDLHTANILVRKWLAFMSVEGRFFSKRQHFPLLSWFAKFHETLVYKFSLYFHNVLKSNTPSHDLRPMPIKAFDPLAKISSFHRKNTCSTIGLLVKTDIPLEELRDYTYKIPGSRPPAVLKRFCAVFSYPHRDSRVFWSPIARTIMEFLSEIDNGNRIIAILDPGTEDNNRYEGEEKSASVIDIRDSASLETSSSSNNIHTSTTITCQMVDASSILAVVTEPSPSTTAPVAVPVTAVPTKSATVVGLPSNAVRRLAAFGQATQQQYCSTSQLDTVPSATLAAAVVGTVGTSLSASGPQHPAHRVSLISQDPIMCTFISEIVGILRCQRATVILKTSLLK